MRIGVIVLSWNSLAFIDDCLKGLLERENCPVYVVDNGSVDGSYESIKKNYPGVTLIRSENNMGFGGGNNLGIRKALDDGCEAVFLLNNDTIIDEPFIDACAEVLRADPSIGIVGPVVVEGDRPGIIQSAGGKINIWSLTFPYIGRGRKYERMNRIVRVDYVLGAAMLIHRKVLDEIGMFDPDYGPAYMEEADLCYRAARKGYGCAVHHGARIRHLGEKSSGGKECAFQRMVINRFLFGLKHLGFLPFLTASQWIFARVMAYKLLGRSGR
jgi:alpha-1,3-rhamnosyl/mannosyltransferase